MLQVSDMSRRAPLILLALTALPVSAEMFSWHAAELGVRLTDRWNLVLSERTRTRREFSYLDQQRVGATIRWSSGRFTPYAGYLYQPQQIARGHWTRGQRVFAGVEKVFALGAAAKMTNRLIAERYFSTGRPDYNRLRTHSRAVFGARRAAPYAQFEAMAVRRGFHSVRASGGMRFRLSPNTSFEAGYLYDCRRTFWGGDRHALVTAFRVDVGRRR